MARTRTLTNLIADCRQRADMVNSTFCTDAEITEYLNQELAEVHLRLTQNQGQPLIRSSTSISVTAGTSLYSLPATFWRLQEVIATIAGTTGNLTPFMPFERAGLINSTAWGDRSPVQYRTQGDNIEFLPSTQTFTATVFFTPASVRLSAPTDVFDGYDGYEMAAIYGAVATMLAKEESDPSFHMAQRDRVYNLIDSVAAQRDGNMPERVQDTIGSVDWRWLV